MSPEEQLAAIDAMTELEMRKLLYWLSGYCPQVFDRAYEDLGLGPADPDNSASQHSEGA